jgi:tetratricopeptide (TPR) repeat protein
MFDREYSIFPITYWIEAIYKKDEKLAKAWIDQMNASVRSMSEVQNAHFYSGYYYYSFFKDYPTAATFFDLCIDDTGFDATNIDYQKINGGNNSYFYYRGVAYYQLGKYPEAYDALFYAFLWSIEPMHFDQAVLFKELVKDHPRDQRLKYLEVVHELNCWYTTKEVRNGVVKKGIKAIKNEIELHPVGTPLHDYAKFYLAFAYHVLGEHDKAKIAFDDADKGQFKPHFSYTLRGKIFN